MLTHKVVLNRKDIKVLRISLKGRVEEIEESVSAAPYFDNPPNPTYFPQKAHANKHIKKQEKLHGI
ncbi:MAG: hypothetical protein ACOH2E_04885 [Candidatus Paracaedibacter sp.]